MNQWGGCTQNSIAYTVVHTMWESDTDCVISGGSILRMIGLSYCIIHLLHSVAGLDIVSFPDWEKINTLETRWGDQSGKPRQKIVDVAEMIHVAMSWCGRSDVVICLTCSKIKWLQLSELSWCTKLILCRQLKTAKLISADLASYRNNVATQCYCMTGFGRNDDTSEDCCHTWVDAFTPMALDKSPVIQDGECLPLGHRPCFHRTLFSFLPLRDSFPLPNIISRIPWNINRCWYFLKKKFPKESFGASFCCNAYCAYTDCCVQLHGTSVENQLLPPHCP